MAIIIKCVIYKDRADRLYVWRIINHSWLIYSPPWIWKGVSTPFHIQGDELCNYSRANHVHPTTCTKTFWCVISWSSTLDFCLCRVFKWGQTCTTNLNIISRNTDILVVFHMIRVHIYHWYVVPKYLCQPCVRLMNIL